MTDFDLDILKPYMVHYNQSSIDIQIENKTLEKACAEQPSVYLFYYDKFAELVSLSKKAQIELDKAIALSYIKLNERHQIKLGDRMISKYLDAEESVIIRKQILAEIDEVKIKFQGVIDGFTSRNWQLSNITKARVAQIEQGLL